MSTVNPPRRLSTSSLANIWAPIAADMHQVEQRLQEELQHSDPFIDQLARRSFRLGGKRIRPTLLLLSAQAVGEVQQEHHILAAVVEMIHTATLVHDDVLDEADIRRHEETVNARWSNQTSVLLGDYLFTHAFYLASTLESTFGCRTIGRATNQVCEGELLQTSASGDLRLSRADYFRMIEAKTAELCACSCQLGAHYAGGSEQEVADLTSFGRHLGIAFQIIDDLLDLTGEETTVGKSLGTDLVNRKMTLPLILLRDQFDSTTDVELFALLESEDLASTNALHALLNESGALDQTRRTAEEHIRLANDHLAALAPSQAKDALQQIAAFVTERNA